MRKQSTGLFTVKSARTFEFRGSSPSALTTKQKKTPAGVFLFWQGQKDLNPRHAVLERKARFQLSRVLKTVPLKFRIKTALSEFESAVTFCLFNF